MKDVSVWNMSRGLFAAAAVALSIALSGCGKSPEPETQAVEKPANAPSRTDALRTSVENDPANPNLLRALAAHYFDSQQYVEAAQTYDRVIEIEPGDAVSLNNRALAIFYTGNPEAALDSVDRALEADPGYGHAWLTKGFILLSEGRNDEAVAPLQRVIEIEPDGRLAGEAQAFLQHITANGNEEKE